MNTGKPKDHSLIQSMLNRGTEDYAKLSGLVVRAVCKRHRIGLDRKTDTQQDSEGLG